MFARECLRLRALARAITGMGSPAVVWVPTRRAEASPSGPPSHILPCGRRVDDACARVYLDACDAAGILRTRAT